MEPHPDIRIGTLAGKGDRTADYVRAILPHGFESFQLNFWQTLGKISLPELAREMDGILSDSSTIISSLGVYGNPLKDDEEGLHTRDCLRQAIKSAKDFGVNIVGGFTGRLTDQPIPDSLETYAEVWGELARLAEDHGVRIAFENCPMRGSWDRGDWNIAHNPAAWERMFNAVDSEALGLEWEPCHQMTQLIDPLPQLEQWMSRIYHVHGKDATIHHERIRKEGMFGERPAVEHRHPGFGDTNWTDVISELRRGGYTGAIDIEGWHDPVYHGELELTGQVRALRYLQDCRGGDWIPIPEGFDG